MDEHRGDRDELDAFWGRAKTHAKLAGVPDYTGVNPLEVLRPPAWAFGATPEQADGLLALVLDGTKTATASSGWDYEDEGEELPGRGTLGIVLDSRKHPRALVVTTRVRTVPFLEVDADHAAAEGEGDRSLEYWRAAHESFWATHSPRGFSPDMPVVLEDFEVLYQE